jgi:hypothetical protein
VKTFEAFKKGRVALRVVSTASGDCWGGSVAVRRSDAWRCHTSNHIYDPCFSKPNLAGGLVLCPTSYPWVRRAVGIKLDSALPYRFGNPKGPAAAGVPWGIQTTDGKSCRAYTGVTKTIGGRVVSYGCSGGGGLIGEPKKKPRLWRIRYARGSNAPVWKGIKTAWY